MKMNWMITLPSLLLTVTGAIASTPPPPPKMEVDPATRLEVIDTLVVKLNAHYVFPDKAKQAEAVLRKHQREGKYDGITDSAQLAKQLSDDVGGVVQDKHFSVHVGARPIPPDDAMPPPPQTRAEWEKQASPAVIERVLTSNLGVEKVDHLSSNIGYLHIWTFGPTFLVSDKFAAAMNTIADTDGLIIDLRNNGGGLGESVSLLISYFVDERTRLNSTWDRTTGVTREYWTHDKLDGKPYGGKKPVFILVGPETKSAAESFAYQMQALKRATVIGERSWGGANASRPYRLSKHFAAFIPNRRSINPITQTNWEGTGVIPDVAAKMDDTLATAKDLMQRQLKNAAAPAATKH